MMALTNTTYVRSLLGALLLTLLAIIGFNWLIDPYRVFGNEGWPGVNSQKFDGNMRIGKAYVISRGHYDAIILGSSRSLRVDAHHPGFAGYNAYNAALVGGTIYESLRFLQHAQGAHPVRRAVLGLDFFSFVPTQRFRPGFSEDRLTLNADGQPVPPYKRMGDYVNALISLDSIRASREAFTRNRQIPPADRVKAGGSEPAFVEGNQQTLQALGGHRAAAIIIERYCLGKNGLWLGIGQSHFLNHDYTVLENSINDFRTLLRFAHRNGIDLKLFISPIHTRLQSATRIVGVEDAWELWKRLMMQANEDVALELGRQPFELWDFASVNDFTTEPVPRDPAGVMQWYEETSHFRKALADQVLDVLFDMPQAGNLRAHGFGVLLQPDMIDAYLAHQRMAREQWMATHPDDMQDLLDQARSEGTLVPGMATGLAPAATPAAATEMPAPGDQQP